MSALIIRHEDEENTPPCKKQRVSAAELVMRDLAVANSGTPEQFSTGEGGIEKGLSHSTAEMVSSELQCAW